MNVRRKAVSTVVVLGAVAVHAAHAQDPRPADAIITRVAGGEPVLGLKRGIDAGLVPGPRIWPAGAMISQSGGHGDFRLSSELPAPPGQFHFSERIGAAAIADDADTVRKRVREQLALGASQIKLLRVYNGSDVSYALAKKNFVVIMKDGKVYKNSLQQ